MTRLDKARISLSDWHFWMGVAYFGIVAVLVWEISLSNSQAREEASRTATQKAANVERVGACFASVKSAPVVKGFLDGEAALITNSLLANEAALEITAPNDPLRQVRLSSVVRLKEADKNARALGVLIRESTPTRGKCISLASALRVDAARYLNPPK